MLHEGEKMSSKIYLKGLSIENFATFKSEQIDFTKSFNAIIGETGSGKSLILDAFQLILGSRADKKLIRKGSNYSVVEGVFKTDGSKEIFNFFDQLGHPFEEDEINIKRILYPTGKSKAYINFQQCSLSTLQKFSSHFVDLVGQFENQKLLNSSYQLKLLDSYSKLEDLLKRYNSQFSTYNDLTNRLESKKITLEQVKQKEDYIHFQINEIEKLSPSIEDEEELVSKRDSIKNIENFTEALSKINYSLSENENGNILSMLDSIIKDAEKNSSLLGERIISSLYDAKEILNDASFELSNSEFNQVSEEDLEFIIERLDQYQKLKSKFGGSTENILKTYHELKKEFSDTKNLEDEIYTLENKACLLSSSLYSLAIQIHKKRINGANELSQKMTSMLQELNMKGASINFEVQKLEKLSSTGISTISLLAETNEGEGMYPIKDIASGGELSRILLSLRKILSQTDSISVFLFDEIDTGIGGKTALKIGDALNDISKKSQVMAITHLPQIASKADNIINVQKFTQKDENRTESKISYVKNPTREFLIENLSPLY